MNKNVFKYLRKKILEHSTFTEEVDGSIIRYKIECLGFEEEVSFPFDFFVSRLEKNILIDKMVEKAGFLERLERIETRKNNLKSLLD
jgi:hypothetical protein